MKKLVALWALLPVLIWAEGNTPLVLSVPKAGGHLALEMLYLFPNIPDCQWADHLVHCGIRNPRLDDSKSTKILIVRDLRDVFISLVYWFDGQVKEGLINRHVIAKRKGLRERIQYWRGCSFDEKLRIVLEDGEQSLYYDGFMRENIEEGCRLLNRENIVVIRFEDLVGPKGGGNKERQHAAIRRIALSLEQELKEDQVETIGEKMFGASTTFRKGQIGSWEGKYNESNLLLFYLRYGRYQKAFGYSE